VDLAEIIPRMELMFAVQVLEEEANRPWMELNSLDACSHSKDSDYVLEWARMVLVAVDGRVNASVGAGLVVMNWPLNQKTKNLHMQP